MWRHSVMIRSLTRPWRGSALGALALILAAIWQPAAQVPIAHAQMSAAPLFVDDLGSGWSLANERWFVPPEGVGNYTSAFQRDPREGLSSTGPIAVTLGIDVLPDTPPAD